MCCSSCRTVSGCPWGYGGGNLPVALPSTDLHTAQTYTEHFWLCVWRTVILKSCFIVRIQHLDNRMHLVTWTFHVVTGSNSTCQSNYRNSRIPRYCCPNQTDPPPCFTVGSRHSGSQASLGVRPNVGNSVKGQIAYFRSSDVQVLSPSHHLFRLLVLFSVIGGLAIAALPCMLDVWSCRWIVFVKTVFKTGTEFCHLCCSSPAVTFAAAVLLSPLHSMF
jgi:hypothetical protein